jgi:probable F420-dependent oxidoreductase
MKLTGTGIWSAGLRGSDHVAVAEATAELEELGYTSLWFPNGMGGALEDAERLVGTTRSIVIGTGIFSLWDRPAGDAAAAFARIEAAHPQRFIMGIGVSHASLVEAFNEGATYEKPIQAMAQFLDGLDAAVPAVPVERRMLAALGPRMLDLAAERSGGALPYLVTPEHTAIAREHLGPDKLLVPEQTVVLVSDPDEARRISREFLAHSLTQPNYANSLRRLGFSEDDLADGGSDRLVDALVAWGDEEAIATRVQAHRDAGADSVCVQVAVGGGIEGMISLPREIWRRLAPVLT